MRGLAEVVGRFNHPTPTGAAVVQLLGSEGFEQRKWGGASTPPATRALLSPNNRPINDFNLLALYNVSSEISFIHYKGYLSL